jgi:hypothetical protein
MWGRKRTKQDRDQEMGDTWGWPLAKTWSAG